MTEDQARQLLDLASDATAAAIEAAFQQKAQEIDSRIKSAPTEALKQKFRQQLAKLHEAKTLLLSGSQPSSQATPPGGSPLSATKLADLPGAAPSYTQGVGGGPSGAPQLQPGQTLSGGRYEIREKIGEGGMGAVYRAWDSNTGQEIAIKIMQPALMASERARERFFNEARLSQKLSHPNIINVFDVQQDGELAFMTMELLEGQSLRQYLDNHQLTRQPVEVEESLDIVNALCDALAYAHGHTVHRDIKPENVFLTEDGEIKLMDFGIARALSSSQYTQTGVAMGTAYYMAPEQLKGRGEVDGRADQYALAVLMYEMLSGEVPTGKIAPLNQLRKDVPARLARAVDQALSPKPDDRFPDIAAFKAGLDKKGSALPQLPRLPMKALGIAAGILLAVGGVGALIASGGLDGLKDLLPESEEVIQARKAEAFKLQGEIKSLKKRLENNQRILAQDIRDAARNNESEANRLRDWEELVRQHIFESQRYTELQGKEAVGEGLLRDKEYQQAVRHLTEVRDEYAILNDQFDLVRDLPRYQDRMAQKWRQARAFKAAQTAENARLADVVMQYVFEGKERFEELVTSSHIVEAVAFQKQLISESDSLQEKVRGLINANSEMTALANRASTMAQDYPITAGIIKARENEIKATQVEFEQYLSERKIDEAYELHQSNIKKLEQLLTDIRGLTTADKEFAELTERAGKVAKTHTAAAGIIAQHQGSLVNAQQQVKQQLAQSNYKKALEIYQSARQPLETFLETLSVIDDKKKSIDTLLKQARRYSSKARVKNRQQVKKYVEDADAGMTEAGKLYSQAQYASAAEKYQSTWKAFQPVKRLITLPSEIKKAIGKLVRIPGGSFRMGSNDADAYDEEKPVHTVHIKPFKMMAYEVTFDQYDTFARATGRTLPNDEGWGRGSRPVINVSWNDAQAFAKWLSEITGRKFRLPTEAEWEYAARAGTTTDYSWGNRIGPPKRAVCKNYRHCKQHRKGTFSVLDGETNQFGLYHMHGNVWEWTEDCWHENYKGAPTNGEAWLDGNCSKRVIRGGSWDDYPRELRSANREKVDKKMFDAHTGFRLVQELD